MNQFGNRFLGLSTDNVGLLLFIAANIAINLTAAFIVERSTVGLFVIILVIVLLSYGFYRLVGGNTAHELTIDSGSDAPSREYVIMALSFLNHKLSEEEAQGKPSNLRLVVNAIQKHHPVLKTIYVITSDNPGVQRSYAELLAWYEEEYESSAFSIEEVKIQDGFNMGGVYDTVLKHVFELRNQKRLDPVTQLIFDVTTGTGAITSGMTMAALATGTDIMYQKTERKEGDKLSGTTTWQYYRNQIK